MEYKDDKAGQAMMAIPAGSAQDPVDQKLSELRDLSSSIGLYRGQIAGMIDAIDKEYVDDLDVGDLSGSPESVGTAAQAKAKLDKLHTDKPDAVALSKSLGQFIKAAEGHNKAIPDQAWVDKLTPDQLAKV